MGVGRGTAVFLAAAAAAAFAPGCAVPVPNDLILLDVRGADRFALSTEDGIVALYGDDLTGGEIPILYEYHQQTVTDNAALIQNTADLGLLKPVTAKFPFSEFAISEPGPDEPLYIQVIDEGDIERRPEMIEARLYERGLYGNLLELEDHDYRPEWLAQRFRGAGVYVQEKGRFAIVGVLNGTVATLAEGDDGLLPFVGLDVIAPVLPRTSSFFVRRLTPRRPDFEYGLTREGQEPPPVRSE
jgi:hypothetical protein